MSTMMRIRVRTEEGHDERVDACKAEVTEDHILILCDAEGGIRARFRRWQYYVREEAA